MSGAAAGRGYPGCTTSSPAPPMQDWLWQDPRLPRPHRRAAGQGAVQVAQRPRRARHHAHARARAAGVAWGGGLGGIESGGGIERGGLQRERLAVEQGDESRAPPPLHAWPPDLRAARGADAVPPPDVWPRHGRLEPARRGGEDRARRQHPRRDTRPPPRPPPEHQGLPLRKPTGGARLVASGDPCQARHPPRPPSL